MKFIFIGLLALLSFTSYAQLIYLGGNAGVTFSNYKAKTPWKEVPNMGFSAGLKGFKQINANYGIVVELQYIQKGYYHKVCNDTYDQLEASYVEVPVMMDYTFIVPSLQNWRGHLNLGIYGAYWLSGQYKMKGYDATQEDFDFKKSNAKRFDFGPNIGGRIEYLLNNGALSLDFRYELGVLDLQKQVNDNTKNVNRAFIVGVSYFKPISK
jgi:Outer membrane protein beta-barrel domain